MQQQEPDYCQILTRSHITIHAHAAGQHPRLPAAAPGRQTTTQTTTPDYYVRACSRTRSRVAACLHCVSHKQQEDNVYAAAKAAESNAIQQRQKLQKLQNLTKFCQILTQSNLNLQKTLLFGAKYAIIYI